MSSPPNLSGEAGGVPTQTPKIGADPKQLRAFVDARIPYQSPVRTRQASDWTKATRYREARPWGEPSSNNGDPTKTPHWADIEFGEDDEDAIPMPVQPEIVVPLQNESARLGRPEYAPYIRPDGENPGVKERTGAKIAERMLQHRLRELEFEEIEAEADMHAPLWGQAIWKVWWEQNILETSRVAVTTAKACPRYPNLRPEGASQAEEAQEGPTVPEQVVGQEGGLVDAAPMQEPAAPPPLAEPAPAAVPEQECRFCVASSHITAEQALPLMSTGAVNAYPQTLPGNAGTKMAFALSKCPMCDDHPDLVDFPPSRSETATGKDHFGQPLGQDVPIGNVHIGVRSPYDLFPQSLGIGVKPKDWQWWVECYAMPLNWVATRFTNGKNVRAENPKAIMEWHPIAGERAIYETGGLSSTVFMDFVRVKEYHEKPSPAFPDGRSIILANDTMLLDSTFMIESQAIPGEKLPRVHLEMVPWEPKPHSSWGLSLAQWLFSLQDSIHMLRSMEEDLRGRMGVVGMLVPRGADLEAAAFEGGGFNGKQIEYTPDNGAGAGGEPKPFGGQTMPEMVPLIQFLVDAMARISGTNDVEGGVPPGGVTAALAMQVLMEKSGERRAPRLRRKREALMRLFTAMSTQMYHRYLEPRMVEWEGDDGQWKQRAYRGIEINGQVRVRIDPEPEHNSTLQRQAQLMDLLKIPNFINLQDPATRDRVAEKLDAPRDLDGQIAMQTESAQREFCDYRDVNKKPVVDLSLDDHQAHHNQHGLDMHSDYWRDQEEQAQWDSLLPLLWNWQAQFPGMATMALTTPGAWPVDLQGQVFACWTAILAGSGVDVTKLPAEQQEAVMRVMVFRAHDEAHLMVSQGQMNAAAAGAQVMAAPNSEQATADGTLATGSEVPVAQQAQGGLPAQGQPQGAPGMQ